MVLVIPQGSVGNAEHTRTHAQIESERARLIETWTDRETDRQTDRQIDRQTDRKTERAR